MSFSSGSDKVMHFCLLESFLYIFFYVIVILCCHIFFNVSSCVFRYVLFGLSSVLWFLAGRFCENLLTFNIISILTVRGEP